ncbi:unnamed protein product, partial [Tilletia caries]
MSLSTGTVTPATGADVEQQVTNPASPTDSFTDEKKQTSGSDSSAEEYPTGLKFALICLACAFFLFLVAIDQTIVSTAIPVVTNQFNSFSDVGWYGSAYLLTSTVFQPL